MEQYLTQGFNLVWRWIECVEESEASADQTGNYKSERYLNLQFDFDKNLQKMRKLVNIAEASASDVQVLLREINGERNLRRKLNENALRKNEVCNLAKNEQDISRHSAKSDFNPNSGLKSISK